MAPPVLFLIEASATVICEGARYTCVLQRQGLHFSLTNPTWVLVILTTYLIGQPLTLHALRPSEVPPGCNLEL
jgi:hypothetical protein